MAGEKKCCRSSRQRVYTASRREAVMEIPAKNHAQARMSVQKMLYREPFLWQH